MVRDNDRIAASRHRIFAPGQFPSEQPISTQAPPAYGLTGRHDRRYKMSLFIVFLDMCTHSLCTIGEQPSTQRRARVAELADARDLGSRG